MELRLYTASRPDPDLVEIELTRLMREIVGDGADLVRIEKAHAPVELEVTLEDAGMRHRCHVREGWCTGAAVGVRCNGTVERNFALSDDHRPDLSMDFLGRSR